MKIHKDMLRDIINSKNQTLFGEPTTFETYEEFFADNAQSSGDSASQSSSQQNTGAETQKQFFEELLKEQDPNKPFNNSKYSLDKDGYLQLNKKKNRCSGLHICIMLDKLAVTFAKEVPSSSRKVELREIRNLCKSIIIDRYAEIRRLEENHKEVITDCYEWRLKEVWLATTASFVAVIYGLDLALAGIAPQAAVSMKKGLFSPKEMECIIRSKANELFGDESDYKNKIDKVIETFQLQETSDGTLDERRTSTKAFEKNVLQPNITDNKRTPGPSMLLGEDDDDRKKKKIGEWKKERMEAQKSLFQLMLHNGILDEEKYCTSTNKAEQGYLLKKQTKKTKNVRLCRCVMYWITWRRN